MLWFFYKRNRLLKKRVSTFIAPSPQLDEYLEKNNFRNVMFIPNFIGITKARPVFDRIIKNQILYAGLLERNKGVSKLIEAMKEVVGKFKSAELKIAGSGSQEKQLRNLAKKLGLEKHVSFLGWVADIDRLYEQSAVIVVPSIWIENAPVTIQEAMLHSRPVIGSNRGGIPWLVEDNKTGFLFDILKKDDLSDKINKLLSKPAFIRIFGANGRRRIENIISKGKVSYIIKLYKEVQ
jgi:glycosyltransferase involved in cell wall biosynthesis